MELNVGRPPFDGLKVALGQTCRTPIPRPAVAQFNRSDYPFGHAKLETTQIYAQVSIRMLKEVHARTHPARLTATPESAQDNAELVAELAEEEAELADEETGVNVGPS